MLLSPLVEYRLLKPIDFTIGGCHWCSFIPETPTDTAGGPVYHWMRGERLRTILRHKLYISNVVTCCAEVTIYNFKKHILPGAIDTKHFKSIETQRYNPNAKYLCSEIVLIASFAHVLFVERSDVCHTEA